MAKNMKFRRRFSLYKTFLENGYSKHDAKRLAKQLTQFTNEQNRRLRLGLPIDNMTPEDVWPKLRRKQWKRQSKESK